MNLYLIETKFGDYYVIADDPTSAEILLKDYVKEYGSPEIKTIKYLAQATKDPNFKSNKMLIL